MAAAIWPRCISLRILLMINLPTRVSVPAHEYDRDKPCSGATERRLPYKEDEKLYIYKKIDKHPILVV